MQVFKCQTSKCSWTLSVTVFRNHVSDTHTGKEPALSDMTVPHSFLGVFAFFFFFFCFFLRSTAISLGFTTFG